MNLDANLMPGFDQGYISGSRRLSALHVTKSLLEAKDKYTESIETSINSSQNMKNRKGSNNHLICNSQEHDKPQKPITYKSIYLKLNKNLVLLSPTTPYILSLSVAQLLSHDVHFYGLIQSEYLCKLAFNMILGVHPIPIALWAPNMIQNWKTYVWEGAIGIPSGAGIEQHMYHCHVFPWAHPKFVLRCSKRLL